MQLRMSDKSFAEELQDYLDDVAEKGGDVEAEYNKTMNMSFVFKQLLNRGLTIEDLDDYKTLIIQECINRNFSTSKETVETIYQIIKY